MGELINKHQLKIQVGTFLLVVGFIIYWVFNGASLVFAVSENKEDIKELKTEFKTLATKEDLQILKQDLKDFINK